MTSRTEAKVFPADDLDDEYIWTPCFPPLTDFESNLRCEICREFFHVPVSLISCRHTFCSICIRNHLQALMVKSRYTVKPHCPSCNAEVDTSGNDFSNAFYPNHQLQKATTSFVQLRMQLKNVLVNQGFVGGNVVARGQGVRKSQRAATAQRQHKNNDSDQEDCHSEDEQEISESDGEIVGTTHAVRGKKSRRHYAGMKKKKLQEICREEGLNSSGSEKELIERHKAFVMAWNAECDSLQPRSREEIVAEIHARERTQKQMSWATQQDHTYVEQLLKHSNHGVRTGNAHFNKKLKDGFEKLIQEGRKRLIEQKSQQTEAEPKLDKKMKSNTEGQQPTGGKEVYDMSRRLEDTIYNCNTVNGPLHCEEAAVNVNLRSSEAETSLSLDHEVSASKDWKTSFTEDKGSSVEDSKENQSESHCNLLNDSFSIQLSPEAPKITASRQYSGRDSSERNKRRRGTSDTVGRLSTSSSLVGPWNCGACTFYNTNRTWSTACCEICGTSRAVNSSLAGDSLRA